MAFKGSYFSFRNQIILAVVALATIPVVLFGFNALKLAGKSQIVVGKIKNTLLLDISRDTNAYFIRLNKSLAFTRNLEKRRVLSEVNINRILVNALQANREILGLGYIRNSELLTFLGENMRKDIAERRAPKLLEKMGEERIVQISVAYKLKNRDVFDLLYPLDNNDFVYVVFTLEQLVKKLGGNKIGETGEFCLVGENDIFFVGGSRLEYRFKFLEIDEVFNKFEGKWEEIIESRIRGYRVKAKKMEGIFWPFWLVFTQKESEINELTRKLKLSTFLVLLGIILLSGSISFVLAKNFSRPIANLLTAVKKNLKGDSDTHAVLDEKDSGELALLIKTFNNMIERIKDTRSQLVEKEKMAAVGEMANIIGHDIRNPLAAIKNAAYFIERVVKNDDERVKISLDIVNREIKTITDIIEDLLGFSRQKAPALSPVDVNELVDEVISIVEIPDNIEVIKEYHKDLQKYNLDRGEMRQVLVNILNNAVQACTKKEKGVVKTITTIERNGDLRILISDNGIGIPKDKLENVFKAFYSTKEGGTGLGMSSAKNIVDRHEGTINILSTVGKGTDIVISIPQKESKESVLNISERSI